MLQFLRSHASSWIMKIILGLILLSFGIWGISGLFVGQGQQILVAKVGKVEISKQHLLHEVQRRLHAANKEMKGANLTLEQAIKMGIPAKILDDLVRKILVEQELKSLQLGVTEGTLSSLVFSDPTFKNEQGRFDKEKFKQILSNNGLSEAQYMSHRTHQLMEAQYMAGVTAASKPAGSFSLRMFNDLFEERTISIYKINVDSLKRSTPSLQHVDTKDLRTYYDAHKESYKTTEKRKFSVLVVNPKDLESKYTFSAQEIKDAYDQQLDNYAIPEKRDIHVYTDKDWRKVKIAQKLLEKGHPMPASGTTVLHHVTQEDLSDKLGEEAFELATGETSEVFKGEEGFQIVRVLKITPPTTKPLNQVHQQVVANLKRQKALDEVATLIQTIEDAISGGASLEEIAKIHGLKLIHIPSIPVTVQKTNIPLHIEESMVKTAFEQDAGEAGPVVELEDGVAYVVRVDQIEAPEVEPFDRVQKQVEEHLLAERLKDAIDKKINFILNNGTMDAGHIQALQKDPSVLRITLPQINYTGSKDHPEITQEIRSAVWKVGQGQGVIVTYKDAPAVAYVERVKPAVVEKSLGEYTSLKGEMAEMLNRDLLIQYFEALKDKYDVRIYEDILNGLGE
jgi:peptidyl-prolyl cis-trans isomerase D